MPIYGGVHLPFSIRRVYFLYDVPSGQHRGGHAHRKLQQLFVSVMGIFDMVLDDGLGRRRIHMDRAYCELYVPQMFERELENFSSKGIGLFLNSLCFDQSDDIRDGECFRWEKAL